MLFYNFEALFVASRGNSDKIVSYYHRTATRSYTQPNFIVNSKVLVDTFWLSPRQKAEYLALLSLRDYGDYVETGYTGYKLYNLPPWIPIEVAKNHPLIQLTDKEIIFTKEENK